MNSDDLPKEPPSRNFQYRYGDPDRMANDQRLNRIRESKKLSMLKASEIPKATTKWFYQNWLAQGELTLLAGECGIGKSTLACAFAAGVSNKQSKPLASDLAVTGHGHVIIFAVEDDISRTYKPRLEAAGANLDMVHFISTEEASSPDEKPFSFSDEKHIDRLDGKCEDWGGTLGLIIIDPVYFAVDGDFTNNVKARAAYDRLVALARRYECAILGLTHSVRNTKGKNALQRVAGPPAIRQVPRAIMLLSRIENGPTPSGGTHVLVHAKNSIGDPRDGYEWCIEPVVIGEDDDTIQTTRIVITNKAFGSAEEILDSADQRTPDDNRIKKSDVAERFLLDALREGPRLWIEIEALAKEAGVKKATLMNAKTKLKVVPRKLPGEGRSEWRLPESPITEE